MGMGNYLLVNVMFDWLLERLTEGGCISNSNSTMREKWSEGT